jgi:hypothetical protein
MRPLDLGDECVSHLHDGEDVHLAVTGLTEELHGAINLRRFHEFIISTLPGRVSRWLKLNLPSKSSAMRLP